MSNEINNDTTAAVSPAVASNMTARLWFGDLVASNWWTTFWRTESSNR